MATILNNNITDTSPANSIHANNDNPSKMCVNSSVNSNGSGGAPQGNINLDETGTTLNVQQSSPANVSSVNNGATVTVTGTPTYNVPCNAPTP